MFRRFWVRLGVMTIPEDEIIDFMVQDLREMLGKWRISQMEHALDLGLQEILTVDMKLYNKPISILFLTQLMRAYQRYIAPAIKLEEKKVEKEVSDKEKKDIMVSAVSREFQSYKKNKIILNGGNSIFEALSDKISIDDVSVRTDAENRYKQHLIKIGSKLHHRKIINETIDRAKEGNYNVEDERKITRIMYDIKLERFFDELIEMDMDVTDLI